MPAYIMLLTARLGDTMTTVDIVFARVLMGLIMIEFFADQQQWGNARSNLIYGPR